MKISATALALLLVLPWNGALAQMHGGGRFGGGAMMGGFGGGGGFHGGGGGATAGGFHGGGFHGGAVAGGFHGGAMAGGFHGGGFHGDFHDGHDHFHGSSSVIIGWPWYDPLWPYYGWPGYYYAPAYSDYYPDYYPSSTVVAAGPAPAQPWYYCNDPAGYYPYVRSCNSGWQTIPTTPPASSTFDTPMPPDASAPPAPAPPLAN